MGEVRYQILRVFDTHGDAHRPVADALRGALLSRQPGMRRLRGQLDAWIERTGDLGSESPDVYALEIADELRVINPRSSRFTTFRENAELMKRWASEGK